MFCRAGHFLDTAAAQDTLQILWQCKHHSKPTAPPFVLASFATFVPSASGPVWTGPWLLALGCQRRRAPWPEFREEIESIGSSQWCFGVGVELRSSCDCDHRDHRDHRDRSSRRAWQVGFAVRAGTAFHSRHRFVPRGSHLDLALQLSSKLLSLECSYCDSNTSNRPGPHQDSQCRNFCNISRNFSEL